MKPLRMLGPTLSPEPAVLSPSFSFAFFLIKSERPYCDTGSCEAWRKSLPKGRAQTQTHPKCGACAEDDAGGSELETQHAESPASAHRGKSSGRASKITLGVHMMS